MNDLLMRYCSGQYRNVWTELINAGSDVSIEPLHSRCVSVATEVVKRSFENLTCLHNRLSDLGYEFADLDNSLRTAQHDDVKKLDKLEREYGPLPIILRAWYEKIASVDFRQTQSQLSGAYAKDGRLEISGLGYDCSLVFYNLEKCLEFTAELLREHPQFSAKFGKTPLPLGGIATNCEPKCFRLPDSSIDGVFYNEGFGDVYFVDELRKIFEAGGFPFWKHMLKRKRPYSPVGRMPDYAELLPILSKDFLDI